MLPLAQAGVRLHIRNSNGKLPGSEKIHIQGFFSYPGISIWPVKRKHILTFETRTNPVFVSNHLPAPRFSSIDRLTIPIKPEESVDYTIYTSRQKPLEKAPGIDMEIETYQELFGQEARLNQEREIVKGERNSR